MSISSSLNAGVMGLNANSTKLSTISDNISNSSTYGYKRSEVEFASLVLEGQSSAYSAGGVRSLTSKDVAATGSLISTGNSTDIAVTGRGLFPVTDSGGVNALAGDRSLQLLPTGSFFADENGNLRTQSGLFLLGWQADTAGEIGAVNRNSGADLVPVNIGTNQFVATPTSEVTLGINLPADATVAGGTGSPYSLPVEYYDNLGRTQTVDFVFTPTVPGTGASNAWSVEIFDQAGDPTTPIGTFDLTFSDAPGTGGQIASVTAAGGATYDATTGNVSINLEHGPVEVFVGGTAFAEGITQLSGPFAPTAVTRDGAPIGNLQSVEVDENGMLQAVYDSGNRRVLYQIPVGDVPNLNGLEARDSQAYSLSASSGNLYFWDAGSGPVGTMAGFALMESTTDIAAELTDLIETQRAYSSNATIVRTVDEMLQETTNLKR